MNTIGIAIPTYNRNDYLVKLLDTIPSDIEINVSDNGGFVTETIKKKYYNIKFDSFEEILPMYKNWNNAIKGLKSEWVCVASDDDVFLSKAFTKLSHIIESNPSVDVLIFGNENIDGNGNITSSWKPTTTNLLQAPNGFYPSRYGVNAKMIGIFFKKKIYETVGGFDEEYMVTASDSHFVQKLLLAGNTLYISDIVSQYRIWNNNLTSQTITTKAWVQEVTYWQDEIAKILKQKGISSFKIKNYHDEVIARNVLGSLAIIRQKKEGITPLIRYLFQFRYPIYANFRTQLSIFKCLLASLVKG